MIPWSDIAAMVFICVTMNHLGLVKAIEETWNKDLPIVNCPKCSTFWSVLVYMAFATHDVISSLAVSFLASYVAIWLELTEGFIDTLYDKVYEKIYQSAADNTLTAAGFDGDSASTLS